MMHELANLIHLLQLDRLLHLGNLVDLENLEDLEDLENLRNLNWKKVPSHAGRELKFIGYRHQSQSITLGNKFIYHVDGDRSIQRG